MSRARFAAALAAIALLALLGAESARFSLWTTSDEPAHLAAAREWRTGPGMVSNFEHPVLMKVLGGVFLPRETPAMEIDETRAGRAPMPFVFAGLVLVTGLFARALAGDSAGLAAAALVAVEPTLRGHGSLVQSDVLVTFFLVAAALALERAARSGNRTMLIASGALYGLAMASKYSAFPFLAVFAAIAALRLISDGFSAPPSSLSKKTFRSLSLVVTGLIVPALVTLFLIQFLAFAGTSDAAFRAGIAHEFAGLPQERAAVALARTFPKSIAAYGAGLLFVQGVAGPGERFNYFFGEISGKGYKLYFPVALGIKLTTAAVLLVLAALVAAGVLAVRGTRFRGLLAARACLPAALGGAYLLAACASNVNIGVRHALPVVPFAIAAAAGTLRTLVPRRRTLAIALAAVVLAATCEAALRLGREISFGNLLCGGPTGVPAILSDSNVDWGQEEGKILRARPARRPGACRPRLAHGGRVRRARRGDRRAGHGSRRAGRYGVFLAIPVGHRARDREEQRAVAEIRVAPRLASAAAPRARSARPVDRAVRRHAAPDAPARGDAAYGLPVRAARAHAVRGQPCRRARSSPRAKPSR